MKVLVAGANGFLGSHIINELLAAGHSVIALVSSTSKNERLETVVSRISLRFYDQMSFTDLTAGVDAVINAAVSYGRNAIGASDVVDGNILFPLRLLESIIQTLPDCKIFIIFGTYYQRYRNYERLMPYVLSKRHFLQYARPLAKNHGIQLVNLCLEHLYGPGDGADKFIPRLINDCLSGVPRIAMTSGEQLRDFVHVTDVAQACVKVLESVNKFNHSYTKLEIGTGIAVSIKAFSELVREQCESSIFLDLGALPYRTGEIMSSSANIARMNKLGWKPKVALNEGIANLINMQKRL